MAGFVGLSRCFLGFFTHLIDRRQIAFAHTVDEALEGQVGDPHQTEVTIFPVKQATGHRLVEVLEPMHTDNRRLAHRLLEEVRIGRATILFFRQLRDTTPERTTISRTEIELGDQHRFVEAA
ncbi:hypothetical protein D3C80_1291320 [compost metagenome]